MFVQCVLIFHIKKCTNNPVGGFENLKETYFMNTPKQVPVKHCHVVGEFLGAEQFHVKLYSFCRALLFRNQRLYQQNTSSSLHNLLSLETSSPTYLKHKPNA